MSNEERNSPEDFELFGTPAEDNLKEVLSRGGHKWSNKTTGLLGIALLVVASASAGAWYGHRTATTTPASAFAAAFGARAGGFGGGTGSGGASGSFPSGGFGGRGVSGTVSSVNGDKVTVTIDNRSTTTLSSAKVGDAVTVRSTSGDGAAPLPLPTTSAAPSSSTSGSAKSSSGSKNGKATATAKPTLSPGAQGGFGPGGAGGPGGGGFNNPAFTACLKENGVTISAGSRPDRNDPKMAAALQACLAKLGGFPRPSGAPTTNP